MDADWEAVFQLYSAVSELDAPARQQYLQRAYSQTPQLRDRTERLLRADQRKGGFLESPPAALVADLLESQPQRFAPGEQLHGYRILALVSSGGMGEIYQAEQINSGNPVALKLIRQHLATNREVVRRFIGEARAAGAVLHRNVVELYAFAESDTMLFLVMEWVAGQTWRALMDSGPIDLRNAIEWARQGACGLAAIHQAGIAHRDIKPDNLMLSTDGVVKILDFGLARAAGSTVPDIDATGASGTISGTLSGTFSYLPPELFRGEPASSDTDVFSLGSVFYELFTGLYPFAGKTPLAVYEAIECRTPAPPSSVCRGIPAEVDYLLLAMLNRDRAGRPGAADVAGVLGKLS